MMPAFTARNVTKFIAKSIVAAKTAELTADAIADHTHYEKDDTVVDIGSKVVGWYVSEKLEPVTDKIVDTAADFVSDRRAKRQAKKDAKKNEK
jgi:hypothetical protein